MTKIKATVFCIIAASLITILMINLSHGCNEAICASIVSKCMLLNSCNCSMISCDCCRDCFTCLSLLYDECCSCVDLCPKPNTTNNPLSKISHIEDLEEPVPGLFRALTAESDDHTRWTTYTYPVDHNLTLTSTKLQNDVKYHLVSGTKYAIEKNQSLKPNVLTVNCTIAFMTRCTSWKQCLQSCQSMGATSFRWFHDGCCECVGDTCINYGVNESRCTNCPSEKEDVVEEEEEEEEYDDYGQNDEFLDD